MFPILPLLWQDSPLGCRFSQASSSLHTCCPCSSIRSCCTYTFRYLQIHCTNRRACSRMLNPTAMEKYTIRLLPSAACFLCLQPFSPEHFVRLGQRRNAMDFIRRSISSMSFPAFLSSWSREKAMWIDSQLLNVDHSWP